MVMKIVDMVAMTGTVSGEDDVPLGAAVDGFRTLAAAGIAVGDIFPYRLAAADGSTWETGIGEYYDVAGAPYFSRYPQTWVSFPVDTPCELYVTSPSWMQAAVNLAGGTTAQKTPPQANATGAVAVGGGCVADATGAAAFGALATAAGVRSVALGYSASAQSEGAVALGSYTAVTGCAAVARGSRPVEADYSGSLLWSGWANGGTALDAAGERFTLPNVPAIALLDVLLSGATAGLADTYAARATVVLKRTAINGTIAIEGAPAVTVIKDDAGAAAPAFSVFDTGADSRLNINLDGMQFNATIVASLCQV